MGPIMIPGRGFHCARTTTGRSITAELICLGRQLVGPTPLVISATSEFFRDAEQLAAFALEARLPTVCERAEMARTGCLVGYGPNRTALRKRMASQIALIFGGAAPGDVAIERPAAFELAVNQKIAKALGLTIPFAVLANADEVIDWCQSHTGYAFCRDARVRCSHDYWRGEPDFALPVAEAKRGRRTNILCWSFRIRRGATPPTLTLPAVHRG